MGSSLTSKEIEELRARAAASEPATDKEMVYDAEMTPEKALRMSSRMARKILKEYGVALEADKAEG